jgi:hypothetical protein
MPKLLLAEAMEQQAENSFLDRTVIPVLQDVSRQGVQL